MPDTPNALLKKSKALERDHHGDIADAHAKVQARAKRHYDSRSRPLPTLKMGQPVLIQDPTSHKWTTRGHIVNIGKHRDYNVETSDGSVKWRNRRFLRPDHAPTKPAITTTTAEDPHQPKMPRKHVSFAPTPARRSDRLKNKNKQNARSRK